jgi:TonB-dependent receptor
MNKTQPSISSQGRFFRWMTAGIAALLLSLASSAYAQQAGTVSGQVVDSSSGKYLEGAEVNINGTEIHTNTERDGRFTLRNVPSGAQKITVNYPGLDTFESTVEVVAGQAVDVPVKLISQQVITLGEFKVQGTKEGMAQAVALQKISIESKLIAANDQFGSISEGNIGEYLKNLPGVGIVYNSNDARGISLRGLRSQFTTVAIDGTPMASASSAADSRRFETEQISANSINNTEIIKTITPDMPANSTGGFVNMITKSAFDTQDAERLDYRFYLTAPSSRLTTSRQDGTWTRGGHYVTRPNLNLNYSKKVSSKLGFNINYSLSEIYHDSPRTAYTWLVNSLGSMSDLVAAGTVHPTTITANGAQYTSYGSTTTADDPTLATELMNNEQKLTHREALAGKIDYKISDSTQLSFSGQWNWYDLTFHQRGIQFNMGTTTTGIQNIQGSNGNLANSVASTINTTTGAVGAGSGRSIWENDQQRAKYVTGIHFNTTLNHDFSDNSKAWITGYWSQANGKYRDSNKGYVSQTVAQYTGGVNGGSIPQFSLDNVLNTPKHPLVTFYDNAGNIIATPDIFNLNNYAMLGAANMRLQPQSALDTKDGVHGDYKYSFDTAIPLSIQTGAAYDVAGRTIRRQQFNMVAAPLVNGAYVANPLTAGVGEPILFDYGYNFGTGQPLDVYKAYQVYGPQFANVAIATDDWRRFDENNKSGYVRADATFFKDLLIVGGVRWEKRDITGLGISAAKATAHMATIKMDYDNWYPSLTFRYSPNRNWVIRGGYSRTVGDPDYGELVPTVTAVSGTGSNPNSDANIVLPNAHLKPYYVDNYDVSVEYYFAKTGVLGGSLFRKDISGFIISQVVPMTDQRVQDALTVAGYDTQAARDLAVGTTPTATVRSNGKSATVQGLELWYNQNLSFLPKPFDGLNLQLNFTRSDANSNDLDTLYAAQADAVSKQINARLAYSWHQVQVAFSTNWTGEVLGQQSNLGTGLVPIVVNNVAYNTLNQYKAPEIKSKFEASYTFSSRYTVTFEIDNIGYRRQEYFKNYQPMATQTQLSATQYIYGDPVVRIGVKGSF